MCSDGMSLRYLRSVDLNLIDFNTQLVKDVRAKVKDVFSVEPCIWQIRTALAFLQGEKHVISISRTGSGKTMTFWIPVILKPDGILIVIVPLNTLGNQNCDQLSRIEISSISLTAETASPENYEVCSHYDLILYVVCSLYIFQRPSRPANFVLSSQTQKCC